MGIEKKETVVPRAPFPSRSQEDGGTDKRFIFFNEVLKVISTIEYCMIEY